MTNDLYLTVVYNPVGDLTQKFLARFDRPSREQLDERQKQAIAALEDIATQLTGAMRSYGIEPLGLYYRDKNGNLIEEQDDTTDDADELDDDIEGDLLASLPAGDDGAAARPGAGGAAPCVLACAGMAWVPCERRMVPGAGMPGPHPRLPDDESPGQFAVRRRDPDPHHRPQPFHSRQSRFVSMRKRRSRASLTC